MKRGIFWLMFAMIWAHLGPTTACAEHRVALVIGNSNYVHATTLANPKNDADDVANALQELGFDVFQGTDLTLAGFDRILRKFARALKTADVALLFYAGHGVQVNGVNYLIPVDGRFEALHNITEGTISLRKIQKLMERRPRINLLFFDACRDNPFIAKLSLELGGSAVQLRQGWADVAPSRGTYIAFASAEGAVAIDGIGRNSPFTAALLSHIRKPGKDVQLMMRDVRKDVINATNNAQIPWEKASLVSKFAFAEGRTEARARFNLTSDKARYEKGGKVRLTVTTPVDCRLTLISTDTKGQSCLLFPHPDLPDNAIKAGKPFVFPPKGALRLPDSGEETFIAMCNASQEALLGASRRPQGTICSKGGPDRKVNDRLFEVATFDPDDQSGLTAKPKVPAKKQTVLRSSLTVIVSEN